MAPYDPYIEAFSSVTVCSQDSSDSRRIGSLHHCATSADTLINETTGYDRNKATCFHDRQTPSSKDCPPAVSLLPPVVTSTYSRAENDMNVVSSRPPIPCRLSLGSLQSDIEDANHAVCPCCHLRRRSSTKSPGLHSTKYIHTASDDCCSDFCPDLSLNDSSFSFTAHPNIEHSKLCEEIETPVDLVEKVALDGQGSRVTPNELSDRTSESQG